jgi:uncharacterized protein (TIGR02145 family)
MSGILFLIVSACKKEEQPAINEVPNRTISGTNLVYVYDSVKDIDGNVYRTVQIGNQTWMAENLKTTRYNDGSQIHTSNGGPAGYTNWFDLSTGAYCWYENDTAYKDIYGALYNWHAVGNGNLCPTGWHVPTDSEWTTLINFLGGENVAAINLTNPSGFAAIPVGELNGWGFVENSLIWWSVTPYDLKNLGVPYAYLRSLWVDKVIRAWEPASYGYSVRCLKD